MHKFLKLGSVSMLAIVAVTNANAAGYVCNDLIEYTSCSAGYYLKSNKCPAGYSYGTGWCDNCGGGWSDGFASEEECGCGYISSGGCLNNTDPYDLIDVSQPDAVDTCEQCSPGYFCPGGTSRAEDCNYDYDNTGISSWGFTSDAGAKSRSECYTDITPGHYLSIAYDLIGKTLCDEQAISNETTRVYLSDDIWNNTTDVTKCNVCGAGTYANDTRTECIACPTIGDTYTGGAFVDVSQYRTCDYGVCNGPVCPISGVGVTMAHGSYSGYNCSLQDNGEYKCVLHDLTNLKCDAGYTLNGYVADNTEGDFCSDNFGCDTNGICSCTNYDMGIEDKSVIDGVAYFVKIQPEYVDTVFAWDEATWEVIDSSKDLCIQTEPGYYKTESGYKQRACPVTNLKDMNDATVKATSAAGATSAAACYIDPNSYFKDDRGTYHFSSNCLYKE